MEDFEKRIENLKKKLEEIKKLKEEVEKISKGNVAFRPLDFKLYYSEVLIVEKRFEKLEKLLKDVVSILEGLLELICGKQASLQAPKEEAKVESKGKGYSELLKGLISK
jgi:prefoldin subunit 5